MNNIVAITLLPRVVDALATGVDATFVYVPISVKLDLSPFLRQPVKRQYPANGGMEHGIVSTKVHA